MGAIVLWLTAREHFRHCASQFRQNPMARTVNLERSNRSWEFPTSLRTCSRAMNGAIGAPACSRLKSHELLAVCQVDDCPPLCDRTPKAGRRPALPSMGSPVFLWTCSPAMDLTLLEITSRQKRCLSLLLLLCDLRGSARAMVRLQKKKRGGAQSRRGRGGKTARDAYSSAHHGKQSVLKTALDCAHEPGRLSFGRRRVQCSR